MNQKWRVNQYFGMKKEMDCWTNENHFAYDCREEGRPTIEEANRSCSKKLEAKTISTALPLTTYDLVTRDR